MKKLDIDTVEPGDILLTARPGKLEKWVRRTTFGTVSHAIICVQHGSFIDSTTAGVQASNLQREFFEDDEEIYHYRLRAPASRETIALIVDYARAETGARYSIPEAMAAITPFKKPSSTRQFCSRLVARVYAKAGIRLVDDTDYCTPEDLRHSPLLVELPIKTQPVSDDEIARRLSATNPIAAMHAAHNPILKVARASTPAGGTMDSIVRLLIENEDADAPIAKAMAESGYLDLWRHEVSNFQWRYEAGLMDTLSSPEQISSLKQYCLGTLKEAYSGGIRFSINLLIYQSLNQLHPRRSFMLDSGLYKTLVKNDQDRREIAYEWLAKNYPHDLRNHMEQIEPHTLRWFSIVDRANPPLAEVVRRAMVAAKTERVCSRCGVAGCEPYRLANGAQTLVGIPSLNLCQTCLVAGRSDGEVWMRFLR